MSTNRAVEDFMALSRCEAIQLKAELDEAHTHERITRLYEVSALKAQLKIKSNMYDRLREYIEKITEGGRRP